jgi:hypothetical protein
MHLPSIEYLRGVWRQRIEYTQVSGQAVGGRGHGHMHATPITKYASFAPGFRPCRYLLRIMMVNHPFTQLEINGS